MSNKIYKHATISGLLATAFMLLGTEEFWYKLFVWLIAYLLILVITSGLSE